MTAIINFIGKLSTRAACHFERNKQSNNQPPYTPHNVLFWRTHMKQFTLGSEISVSLAQPSLLAKTHQIPAEAKATPDSYDLSEGPG